MDEIRFPSASRRTVVVLLCLAAGLAADVGNPPLRDAPITWHDDDQNDIPKPAERDPNVVASAVDATFFRPMGRLLNPVRWVRGVGTWFGGDPVGPAANVNRLDEVPNSSWFTNRIGLFPTTTAEAARGPMMTEGPARTGAWTIVAAKTEGVTPGFNIEDDRRNTYVIKFDALGCPSMATAPGVISGRILHTAGYNVPEDLIVTVQRDRLVLGDSVIFTPPGGEPRLMTEQDVDDLLDRVERSPDGTWRALASKWLSGGFLGPFDWRGRRKDDPNDRVNHEDRRELRGLRVIAAWIGHYDTKQDNTLDMHVEEGDRHFVRHYLIDFASTLGAGALGPVPAASHEYSLDVGLTIGRTLALGLWEDPWRTIERPEDLREIGLFQSDVFHPMAYKPLEPNTAFANFTDRDGYWAAKIISAFTDEHLEAIVAEGRYKNPDAARWIARVLAERRDIVARYFFDLVAPLDFFVHERGRLTFHDLGAEREIYDRDVTTYRARVAGATPERSRGSWSEWIELEQTVIELDSMVQSEAATVRSAEDQPFLAIEVQVSRGGRWSASTVVYVARTSGRVVELSR
jgi:hypothetical protein